MMNVVVFETFKNFTILKRTLQILIKLIKTSV